jgi:hypothetical protein
MIRVPPKPHDERQLRKRKLGKRLPQGTLPGRSRRSEGECLGLPYLMGASLQSGFSDLSYIHDEVDTVLVVYQGLDVAVGANRTLLEQVPALL